MASNYPGGLDSFDAIAADKKTSDAVGGRTHRDMHNDLGDAIEAVQTELGTDPKGSAATVKARLDAIETGARLGTNSVGATQLADSAVDTAAIQDSAVTSAKIADGTIVNADISASAAIAVSKLAGHATTTTDNAVVRFDGVAGSQQNSGVIIDDNNRLTVATGATGGYGFISGAVHLSGTGSPEGVIAAAPGSTWLQTDSTTDVKGWLRWIKATGTGNTGWVAEGALADTGWRDVSASLLNGWAANGSGGALWIRRQGDRVTLLLAGTYGLTAASKTANTFYTPPTGFAVPGASVSTDFGSYGMLGTVWNQTTPLAIQKNSTSLDVQGAAAGNTRISGAVTWHTKDTWPSSLPGSAA